MTAPPELQTPNSRKPNTRGKTLLAWAIVLGTLAFWVGYAVLQNAAARPAPPLHPRALAAVSAVLVGLGLVGLLAGVGAYALLVLTQALTFDFSRPVWPGAKSRVFVAAMIVPPLVLCSLAAVLTGLLAPALTAGGMSFSTAFFLVFFGAFVILQLALIWVLVWAPVETRLIQRRMEALAIPEEFRKTGALIGLSDPRLSSVGKGIIEDDIGMLWIGPETLSFRGDREQFDLPRESLAAIERKADGGSTTALSGTAHVVLQVWQPGGMVRPIRLHTEGIWTLGRKRTAMDDLARRLHAWRAQPPEQAEIAR